MRTFSTLLSALLLAFPARAQLVPGMPVSVEVRPSLALPVGGFADPESGPGAGTGFGGGATVRLQVTSRVAAYGSYRYVRFGCERCSAVGLDGSMPEAGFEAGVRGTLPYRLAGLGLWLEAGALIHRELEISGGGGDLGSDPAFGWAAGAGVLLPLGASLHLGPGVHYRRYSAEFAFPDLGFALLGETGGFAREVDVADLSFEIGLAYAF